MSKDNTDLNEIARAIFIVNRHAKTALDPKHLYQIKKIAIKKLIQENKAKKIGLHFSNNPKFSNQHSTLLVQIDNYYFHIPPSKEDFKKVKHLGTLNENYRNPKTRLSLTKAKQIIYKFIDWKQPPKTTSKVKRSSYFTPSSLGQFQWKPKNNPKRYY